MMEWSRKHPEIKNFRNEYGSEQSNQSYQYHSIDPPGLAYNDAIIDDFNDLLRTEFKLNDGDTILLLYSW